MSKAQELIDSIIALPEEATSPNAAERKADMLDQIAGIRDGLGTSELRDFDDFVHYAANQRYLANGGTDEILDKMHPRELQLVVQKFATPAHAPASSV